MFLKEYKTENNMAAELGCDKKTFRYWVWFFIEELSSMAGEVVRMLLSPLSFICPVLNINSVS